MWPDYENIVYVTFSCVARNLCREKYLLLLVRKAHIVLVLKDIKPCPKNLTCFRARQSPQFHRAFIVTAKIS